MTTLRTLSLLAAAALTTAACASGEAHETSDAESIGRPAADTLANAAIAVAADTVLPSYLTADGIAAPVREAMLSTRLMASVTDVLVREGDRVHAGQPLVRLDARDLAAKAEQVEASLGSAEAQQAQAVAQVARLRALFADEAAPKAMLEQAETQLAQAESAVRAARAARAELSAIGSYAELRAPFDGRVTQRFVDPGAFAAPGAPLLAIQDDAALRLTIHVTPQVARGLRSGMRVEAAVEGVPVEARIEGIVPAAGGLQAVNAIVPNRDGALLAGSAATLRIASGRHAAIVVPADAVQTTGDLAGVLVRTEAGDVRRWIRVGARHGDLVEVLGGLQSGERVVWLAAPRVVPGSR